MSATGVVSPRFGPDSGGHLCFGGFRFDRVDRLLSNEDGEVALPPRALSILEHLVERAGSVVSKRTLMDAVWPDTFVSETSLTEAVSLVRQALGDDPQRPQFIQTVHRRGYRFVAPVRLEAAAGEETSSVFRLVAASEPGSVASPWIRPVQRLWPASVIALLAVSAAAIGAWRGCAGTRAARPEVVRFSLNLPVDGVQALKSPSILALSPDGSDLVFVGSRSGRGQLYRRALDQLAPTPIAGTEGGLSPFVSPDGRWIGFFAEGKLKKMRLDGGAPVSICDAGAALGASWGEDGRIVFAADRPGGLMGVPDTGGLPERLTAPETSRGELAHLWPEVLPGARAVVYTVWTAGGLADARIAVRSLATGVESTLVRGASCARYTSTGHLVFAREGALAAARFDLDNLKLDGPSMAVLDGVSVDWFTGAAQYSLSRDGSLVYLPGTHAVSLHQLVHSSESGDPEALAVPERPFMNLAVSPDQRRLAVTIHEGTGSDLWVTDLERGVLERLTFEAHNIEPAWTPDGTRICFASSRSGPYNIYAAPADGSAPPERLLASPRNQYPTSWSPDGQLLAYTELSPDTAADLWALPVGTRGDPQPLLQTRFDEDFAAFSPDGRWLAYQSNESGRWEISLRPFPSLSPRHQVSRQGGRQPRWSPDGRRLFFQGAGGIWIVDVRTEPRLEIGTPRRTHDAARLVTYRPFSDGVIAIRTDDPRPEAPAVIVVGWESELRRLTSTPSAPR